MPNGDAGDVRKLRVSILHFGPAWYPDAAEDGTRAVGHVEPDRSYFDTGMGITSLDYELARRAGFVKPDEDQYLYPVAGLIGSGKAWPAIAVVSFDDNSLRPYNRFRLSVAVNCVDKKKSKIESPEQKKEKKTKIAFGLRDLLEFFRFEFLEDEMLIRFWLTAEGRIHSEQIAEEESSKG